MKLIIAGSRHLLIECEEIHDILRENLGERFNEVDEIVSGGAKGVDRCGETYARFAGKKLSVFPAEWFKHGKSAGPKRNLQMATYSDVLLLIWDGQSKGSANMKARMEGMKKLTIEVIKK